MIKRLTFTIEARHLTLADVQLMILELQAALARDVVHTMPPTRMTFGAQGVQATLRIGEPSGEVRASRARIEGTIAELARIARTLNDVAPGDTHGLAVQATHAVQDLIVIMDLLKRELSS